MPAQRFCAVRLTAPARVSRRPSRTHGTCLVAAERRCDIPAMNRSLSYASSSRDGTGEGNLVVRRGRPADQHALAILAALDSARPLTGRTVVGEVDGRVVAAVSLHDGRVVADPFVPTASVVEVLRVHTAGGRSAAARPRRGVPRVAGRRLAPRIA
jgi:hypothetical protein